MKDTHTTAHIPDEAVQAREKIEKIAKYFINEGSRDYTQEICYALKNVGLELLDALNDIPHLSAPCAVEVPTKEERHANTSRNLIINQTSTDLEQIINGHDPEQSILNNDVWDRLDKMACEIEALTKPVDVAAVRRQAFEEGFENGVEQSLNALDAYDDITRNEAEQGIRKLKPDYRALSAEPVQGCGSE
ncbi:hypothetical protein P8H26_12610 [Pseudochrobactrum sp. sp1633]|uniref:hypothetical protein n=1 Tax=Pseudochrobactrum sp. sp1633 TaxID=3036706 RepID=UPI0025A61794|nr:hypothetical protein [Pseudochrobactrum sp. sp1633]MDM8346232.1 hypothetical protein [Pseudochrobactrum sp. sp1633]